jgi:hypothetical protein
MNSGCAKYAKLATIKEKYIQLQHDESVLIGCPLSQTGINNLKVRAMAISTRQPETLYVNHIIARCNNGKIEYSGFDNNYELKEPSSIVCKNSYKPKFEYTENKISEINNFIMYFQVYNANTEKFVSVQIMDGILDAKNNALFTHISMVGSGCRAGFNYSWNSFVFIKIYVMRRIQN